MSCPAGRASPALAATRPDGRNALLHWWSTGDPDSTGPGTSPLSKVQSMTSVYGFTPSDTRPAEPSWIPPKRLPWIPGSRAGGQDGPGAESQWVFSWLIPPFRDQVSIQPTKH